jgi:hypothetical protein
MVLIIFAILKAVVDYSKGHDAKCEIGKYPIGNHTGIFLIYL